jgi:hypothetical protein
VQHGHPDDAVGVKTSRKKAALAAFIFLTAILAIAK